MTATATATVTATATTTAKVTADPAEPTDTALESLMEQSDTLESILNISTVDDLDQLVGVWEAFTGEVCLHDQTGQVELSTESTVCGPGTVLSTYEDFSDLKARVDESDEALLGRGLSEQWLVGDNWIINSNETDLEKLSELISGHVITLGN